MRRRRLKDLLFSAFNRLFKQIQRTTPRENQETTESDYSAFVHHLEKAELPLGMISFSLFKELMVLQIFSPRRPPIDMEKHDETL